MNHGLPFDLFIFKDNREHRVTLRVTELETQVRAEQSKVREEKNKVAELQRELERKERKADATNVSSKANKPQVSSRVFSVLAFCFRIASLKIMHELN